MGYGYELSLQYTFCTVKFCDIQNIHHVRSCLKSLSNLIDSTDTCDWYIGLHNSGWLHMQKNIIRASKWLVRSIYHSNSVVVHCSDGWDRTTQIVCLGQIALDPYYRTIEGFIILIEKDWLSFGHKFDLRSGHDDSFNNSQRAPIFHQFIECVWQITELYPEEFQFNEYFLIFILDQLYSCRFGTFLYGCERERYENNISQTTPSLWDYILSNRSIFINPFYRKSSKKNPHLTLFRKNPQILVSLLLSLASRFKHPNERIRHPLQRKEKNILTQRTIQCSSREKIK